MDILPFERAVISPPTPRTPGAPGVPEPDLPLEPPLPDDVPSPTDPDPYPKYRDEPPPESID